MKAFILRHWRDYLWMTAILLAATGIIGAPLCMLAGLVFAIRDQWLEAGVCMIPIALGLCALGFLDWEIDRMDKRDEARRRERAAK